MTLLRATGLRVAVHETDVLHGVDLSVDSGETVGLVGESGSGKSITALALMALLPDSACASGSLLFDGIDLLAADEAALCTYRGARAGMVFQEPMTALNPLMRVRDQVAEPLLVHGRAKRDEARQELLRLLARVGIAAPEAYPHQLSGGQRQRVGIAMALACGPKLLIADEPTTALDVIVQQRTLDLLAGLVTERNMALLLISHDLAVVGGAASRVLVMYAGRVVEEGATDQVFGRMAHPYTRALFAASPHLSSGAPVPIPGRMPDPQKLPRGCAFAPRCPRAQADCLETVPPLAGNGAHKAACFHPFA